MSLTRRSNRQPPESAQLNSASGIRRPVAGFISALGGLRIFGDGKHDLYGKSTGVGFVSAPATFGVAAKSTSSNTSTFRLNAAANQFDTIWEKPSTQVTAMLVFKRTGTPAGVSPIFSNQCPNDNPYTAWGLFDQSSNFAGFEVSAGGSNQHLNSSTQLPNNQLIVLIGKYDGAKMVLSQNGVRVGTMAASGAITYPNVGDRGPSVGNFYNFTLASRSAMMEIYGGVLWDVAISDAEEATLAQNPWALLASQARGVPYVAVASAVVSISPAAASASANGAAPSIGQPITVTPAAASASATGAAPTVAQPVSISPGAAASVAAGAAPTIGQPITVTPAAAGASAVGVAPNIAQSVSISPLPAACVGAGAAPTIVRGQSVMPGAAACAAVGVAPDINQGLSVTPGAAAVVAAGAPPSIVRGQSVAPGAAVVTATGAVPTVAQPSGISPAPAAVAAAGGVPTLIQGRSITPGAAAVTAAGAAPNISGAPLISPAACTIAVASPAPSISQPIIPIPTRIIDIKQDDLLTAIRSFLLTLVTQPVLRTPINRAAMPVGSHITMSPGSVKALATNTHGPIINGVRSVKRSSQFDCQIDCYGIDAGDTAAMISMMFRDQYAIEQFELQQFEIVPLYAEDAHQMPVVTGEEQYLERWTFDIVVQFNPVVSMVAQSATMLELSLRNVDRTYPP